MKLRREKERKKKKKKKESLPLISRNLSIDVTVSKNIPNIPAAFHRTEYERKQIAKSPARDRCSATPSTRTNRFQSRIRRGEAQWSLKVSSFKGTFNSTCDKYRKNKHGGRGAKGSRLLCSRTLKYATDDYTRGSRVTIHLVLPLSTLLRTSNGRQKKRILLTSDMANFYGSLDAQKGRMISDLSSRIFC